MASSRLSERSGAIAAQITPEIDPLLFREILASFPAGVVIVTAVGADGIPSGVTVSAFCSVSADPPLVLVCIDKGSRTLAAVQAAGKFTVNILHAESEERAMLFASKREDKFSDIAWEAPGHAGAGPVLRGDAAAHLVCVTEKRIEAGDHWIFVGQVVEADIEDVDRHLLYHRRAFSAVG